MNIQQKKCREEINSKPQIMRKNGKKLNNAKMKL